MHAIDFFVRVVLRIWCSGRRAHMPLWKKKKKRGSWMNIRCMLCVRVCVLTVYMHECTAFIIVFWSISESLQEIKAIYLLVCILLVGSATCCISDEKPLSICTYHFFLPLMNYLLIIMYKIKNGQVIIDFVIPKANINAIKITM